jgi:RNA polymerase sigma-70 factor (ECF subfamily)
MADLAGCVRGDKTAWHAFVEGAAPIIFAAIRRTLGHSPDPLLVEDLAQDVFVRLVKDDFRLLKTYDPARASLSTWLSLVARSRALDHLRRQKSPPLPLDAARGVAAPPEAEAREFRVPEGLLSPRQRLVLTLLVEREMSVEQAAATIGVDPQTIRSTKHKAIAKLREFFRGDADAAPRV